mmetsp:Transcript_134438/g.200074  ORF Transcript_134438/g.200074 Transcript_134438/m.200074 type:complete len:115 (-) Transcript_134438:93-437(-)
MIGIAFCKVIPRFEIYHEYDFTGRKRLLSQLQEENLRLKEAVQKYEAGNSNNVIRSTNTLLNWPAAQIGKLNFLVSNILQATDKSNRDHQALEIASQALVKLFESIIRKQKEYS